MKRKLVKPVKRMRLSVFRSNTHIYAQVIDDAKQQTIVSASDINKKSVKRLELAMSVGEELAKKAFEKGVKEVAFDRGSYKYHGRVKALAEGARKGGLVF